MNLVACEIRRGGHSGCDVLTGVVVVCTESLEVLPVSVDCFRSVAEAESFILVTREVQESLSPEQLSTMAYRWCLDRERKVAPEPKGQRYDPR